MEEVGKASGLELNDWRVLLELPNVALFMPLGEEFVMLSSMFYPQLLMKIYILFLLIF